MIMKQKLAILLFILLFIPDFIMFAGISKIDSLRMELSTAEHDTVAFKLYYAIGYEFESSIPDSALHYYYESLDLAEQKGLLDYKAISLRYIGIAYRIMGDFDKALEYYHKSLAVAEKIGDKNKISAAYNSIGIILYRRGNFHEAIEYLLNAAEIEEQFENFRGLATIYNNIGLVYNLKGLNDKSIEYHLKSLNFRQKLDDKMGMAASYNNIGSIHQAQRSYDEALEYYLKAMEIYEEIGSERGMGTAYNNLGLIYRYRGNYEKAIKYYLKSIEIRKALGAESMLLPAYNNLGIAYRRIENFDKALVYFNKAIALSKKLEDDHTLSIVYNSVGNLYFTLYEKSNREENLKLAEQYHKKSYDLAVETGALPRQSFAANHLRQTYTKMGRLEEALKYAEIFIVTNDSLFNQEKSQAVADAESKFQAERRQLLIDKLEREKALQDTQLLRQKEVARMQNIIITVIIAGLLIISLLLIVVLQRLKVTRSQKKTIEKQKKMVDEKNIILNEQNEEIRAQNEEIEQHRDEISAQRDLYIKQKEIAERNRNQITNSIAYAQIIQNAVLPSNSLMKKLLKEYFIIYKPKEIVSGDFYWITTVNDKLVLAVGDCTGHGVPGAFMSMLGLSFLKEIVSKKGIIDPAEILELLRESIIEALQQEGKPNDQIEGIDMGLCVLDKTENKLLYAGANITLLTINTSKELKLIKPDKQTLAYSRKMKPFQNKEVELNDKDCIYLASDGYQSQLGGNNYRMFLAKNFHKLLTYISDKPMHKQKENLEDAFNSWKVDNEQVDDITIIGLKI